MNNSNDPNPARTHPFEPGGQRLSIYEEVDPDTVCRHCMLGRPAHEKPTSLDRALSATLLPDGRLQVTTPLAGTVVTTVDELLSHLDEFIAARVAQSLRPVTISVVPGLPHRFAWWEEDSHLAVRQGNRSETATALRQAADTLDGAA